MKGVCSDCGREVHGMYPCEEWLIARDQCPVGRNKLLPSGGFNECITDDWAKCG